MEAGQFPCAGDPRPGCTGRRCARLVAECRARLMYLVSTHDEIIARTNLHEVLLHAPQTEVAEIEGAYLALFTNPEQSAARIAGFLRRLPCAGWESAR
jgi:hypothetical protein